jgi:K+-sensing histidine kinase KdpD
MALASAGDAAEWSGFLSRLMSPALQRRVTATPTPAWTTRLSTGGRYGLALVIVALSWGAAQLLVDLTQSNRIGGAFLVGVLVISYLAGSGPGYAAAVISFVIYNFYVEAPPFHLQSYRAEDALVLLTFPTVALLMGNLTGRLRDEAKRAEARARATAVLFEATREFSASDDPAFIRSRLGDHLAAAARGQAFVLDGEVLSIAGGKTPDRW